MRTKVYRAALSAHPFLCCFLFLSAYLFGEQTKLEQAWSLAARGERDAAITLLRELVQTKPSGADARLLLGSLQAEAGQREEAISQLAEAVRLLPKSPEALNALGEAYNRFGNSKEARTAFERAVALNPNFGVAQENLGAVLLQLGDANAAATHLDRAITLLKQASEAADAHYLRAKIFSAESNNSMALKHLQMAVAIRPDFPEGWSDLGVARNATGDDDGALAAFRRAVELNENEGIAQYRLGSEYLRRAEPQLAIGPLQAAYRLNP